MQAKSDAETVDVEWDLRFETVSEEINDDDDGGGGDDDDDGSDDDGGGGGGGDGRRHRAMAWSAEAEKAMPPAEARHRVAAECATHECVLTHRPPALVSVATWRCHTRTVPSPIPAASE